MKDATVDEIIQRVADCLAEMEILWPAYDLDINRHMVLHISEHMKWSGPTWALTMFPFERKWKFLGGLRHQTVHPESNIMKEFRAFKLALHYLSVIKSSPSAGIVFS